MFVSVLSDASRDPHTGVCGWGGYARSDRGRMMVGGGFVRRLDGIDAAEAAAIVNTMTMALRRGVLAMGDTAFIQMDSVNAMRSLQGERRRTSDDEQRAVEAYRELVLSHRLTVRFRHVKAHTGRREPRYFANHFCDTEAYRHMVALRKRAQ